MNELEQRISYLENVLAMLVKSDRYTVQKDIQMFDGRNIQVASGTGTKMGTGATQKLGFFGSVPIVQWSSGTGRFNNTSGGGGTPIDTTFKFNGNTGSTYYSIGDIVAALKSFGFFAA